MSGLVNTVLQPSSPTFSPTSPQQGYSPTQVQPPAPYLMNANLYLVHLPTGTVPWECKRRVLTQNVSQSFIPTICRSERVSNKPDLLT